MKNEAVRHYGWRGEVPDATSLCICISHRQRKLINERVNNRTRPTDAVYCHYEPPERQTNGITSEPQCLHIWPGLELLGHPRGAPKMKSGKKVVQGVVYAVQWIRNGTARLRMTKDYIRFDEEEADASADAADEETDEAEDDTAEDEAAEAEDTRAKKSEVDVPVAELAYVTRPYHALCNFTVQGSTLRERRMCFLLDLDNPYFMKHCLIVGMSRVELGCQLRVVDPADQGRFLAAL